MLHPLVMAQSYDVQLHSVDGQQALLGKEADAQVGKVDAATAFSFLKELIPALQEKGFLAASIDSISIEEAQYKAYIFLGVRYKWAKVSFDGVAENALQQAAVNKAQFADRSLRPGQVAALSERILQWAENNGYPFAKVWLEQVSVDDAGGVNGRFVLDKGALQSLDTIIINGDVKVSRSYMLRYLDISQKEPYNEKKLRLLTPRVNELPFLQQAQPWVVKFKLDGNALELYLKEKKANQLNAIIGLIPNSVETGKFLLTADAQLAFQNILSQGESISATYQNLQYKSPRFKADIIYPFVLNTPFGLEAHFDLFKKDTIFRRTTFLAGIRYQLNASDYVKAFYQNQSNRLIFVDTVTVKATRQLPENADVAANGGGVELGFNHTDYKLNPHRGFEAKLSGTALLRKVSKANAITSLSDSTHFDYSSLYDTVVNRQYQFFINGIIAYYLPLAKSLVLKAAYNGAVIIGNNLFRNELYQIGGFRLLRGFDEQSVFANQYHVATLELRVLLNRNSYFYLFSDNGYVETKFGGFSKDDMYNGFGLGVSLETKSGLFSIAYGIGRNSDIPLQFRQSKIHFGYVAYF